MIGRRRRLLLLFDKGTDRLWVADVGQRTWEEKRVPADAPGINIPASAMPGSAPTLLLDSELAISASAPDGQGEPLLTSYAGGLYRFAGR